MMQQPGKQIKEIKECYLKSVHPLLIVKVISNDEANFPYKLLLTNRKVANLRKAFANKS